jgi:uncharacterized protein
MKRRYLVPLLLVLLISTVAGAKAKYPEPQGYVNDFAAVLTSAERQPLEALLNRLRARTGAEVVVVTLPSINDEPISTVANDLFKEWGVGQKGKDNGLLFLIAPNDRRMWIEVGYGLEPILNDARTGRIQDDYVLPDVRAGHLGAGIIKGTEALVQAVAEHHKLSPEDLDLEPLAVPEATATSEPSFFKKLIQFLFIIFLVILFIRNPTLFFLLVSSGLGGGGGGRSSGGFGGGFGGFGGGSSGGGGSGRSW